MFLCVYGTLKRGHERYPIIENDTAFVDTIIMPGVIHNYQNQFPVWNIDLNGAGIQAELFTITGDFEELMGTLDEVEGVPFLFERQQVEVEAHMPPPPDLDEETLEHFAEDQWVMGWSYRGVNPRFWDYPVIESGVWPLDKNELETE